jgi:regulator of protease activity HflC (stomatin/prohibitin superfamily)
VTDDPTQDAAGTAPGANVPTYIQITEVVAGPLEAAEAIERVDEQGRVPVMVRIHRQPPINPVWILIAIGLAASGLFLPLVDALRAIIFVAALVCIVVGLLSRLFMRIPPGTVGLVARGGRHQAVLDAGVRRVSPLVALTHVITTRELAFDVPIAAVRSADGVNVNVDIVLTLGIEDPVKFAYSITTGDLDEFIHATCQESVRLLVRATQALEALDLATTEADRLRQSIDGKLGAYGVGVRNVAFTRVTLPEALTASLEARRLAVVQLSEEKDNFALEERRLNDRASLIAREQEARRAALELEGQAEALRLAKLDERIAAYPRAAQYDLEMQRLKVAQQLAGNAKAVVSIGGNDLVSGLLTVQQAATLPAAAPAPDAAPPSGTEREPATPSEAGDEAAPRRGRVGGGREASGRRPPA